MATDANTIDIVTAKRMVLLFIMCSVDHLKDKKLLIGIWVKSLINLSITEIP